MSHTSQIDPEAFAWAADGFAQILELAVGYREKCLANGFSPTAAETMAMQLHAEMMALAMRQTS